MISLRVSKEGPGRYVVRIDRIRFVFKRERDANRFVHAGCYAHELIADAGALQVEA